MRLPLFLTLKTKYWAGGALLVSASLMYFFTNHHPVFVARELPMLWIDRVVPFLPWSVLVYVSEYFFFPAVYLICRDTKNLNKYLYSFFATQAFSCVVFFFWPTVYPRELFPITADVNPYIGMIWTWLREADAATNCFPSLHVSTVYLSAYLFLDEQRAKFPFFLTWATLIAFSTLPTKQHYFVDILAGWALSVFFYWLFHRKLQYRVRSQDTSLREVSTTSVDADYSKKACYQAKR